MLLFLKNEREMFGPVLSAAVACKRGMTPRIGVALSATPLKSGGLSQLLLTSDHACRCH